MTAKNLGILIGAAVILGGAAYFLNSGTKGSSPKLNGKKILPNFSAAEVAKIEFGDKLRLAATDRGWVVETYRGYPASREKIVENLLKLQELKVGQVARGKKLTATTQVVLKNVKGAEIAKLPLGEKHAKWGHGRYAAFNGETVLVSDALDAFDNDPKKWIETKIVDDPWISFNDLADEKLTDAELGFKTGIVAKVTIDGNTNRVATIGGIVKGGTDRYLKLDGSKWVYQVSSYSVDKFLPKPPAKDEKAKASDAKPEVKPAVTEAKKAPAKEAKAPAKPVVKAPAKEAKPAAKK